MQQAYDIWISRITVTCYTNPYYSSIQYYFIFYSYFLVYNIWQTILYSTITYKWFYFMVFYYF